MTHPIDSAFLVCLKLIEFLLVTTLVATSSSDEKLARAKTLGADETINYSTKSNWERDVR
ncbi:alcohol dehydrogenase, catalytic domain, GroES-like family / oxidoreductase, zinc-binding dehydrogenase family multi-domain protein [Leptospira ellinghausenii]|uniref:Alcohol dehydrogenase, catalytic domain, GroES-like family / oxidoreductase, zinc-binding dehydrogenase family multi-domain protein n=1 Tax=Leptospira ellinghausenii TaxID=1917822 RepID=A0A2P2DHD9_9LEPT|nr:alcohol dehydrogenase, catalytic domain, GroES-like family / oxidoreductase, zinc-binding dehydrogenase family multi-domain protein [Leptospira ellinghausenii]